MEDNLQNNIINPLKKKVEIGPFVSLVIILILIVIGGLYFWTERLTRENVDNSQNNSTSTSTQFNSGKSDSTNTIEGDLKATSFNSIDEDLKDLNTAQ